MSLLCKQFKQVWKSSLKKRTATNTKLYQKLLSYDIQHWKVSSAKADPLWSVLWRNAATLLENTRAEVWFQ